MKKFKLILVFLLVSGAVFSQKKPLDHSVYDGWENISTTGLSEKGNLIFYIVSPQEGDAELFVKNNKGETLTTLPRSSNPKLTHGESYLVSMISPFFKDTRQAKIDKKKKDEMPKDSLAYFSFKTKEWTKVADVNSYQLARKNGNYLVYIQSKIIEIKKDSVSKDTTQTDKPAAKKGKPEKPTNNLVVFKFGSGVDTTIKSVDSYLIDADGKYVIFTKTAEEKDSTGKDAGVFKYSLATRTIQHLLSGKGTFKGFTFDENGNQLAFLGDTTDKKALLKDFKVYYHQPSTSEDAKVLVDAGTRGIPENWYVSGNGNLKFSKNGEKLFFGTAPIPRVKDTTLVEFEHAKVDIWHWKDDYLMTQQLYNLQRDLNKNYLAVMNLNDKGKIIQLADLDIPDTRTTQEMNNEYILGTTDVGRRIETQWQTGSYQDFYIISTRDGHRKIVAENVRSSANLSPQGKYVYWYDRQNQNWYTYSIETGNTVVLNKDIKTSFANEDNDSPDSPMSYGQSGWTANDDKVWIYDKYDIWSFKADGSAYQKLTNGRENGITYRYSDWKEKETPFAPSVIEEKGTLVLNTFHQENKENGFAKMTFVPATRKNPAQVNINQVIWDKYAFGGVKEAKDASIYIYTKANYENSPDLFISNDFVNETRLSAINPQQKGYLWGTAELYKWTTTHGYPAEGILYKPENFDPEKTYPVIAYFYEKLSNGLYSYQPPAPTPSRLNIPYFVSNGYVVFAPDIQYETGHPGQSAVEYINSGMASLKRNKWAGKMGIQGQSWGGYQVAYLITTTNMYDAAWAGAPVANMTSAYGGIRWESGMNRQFQYEHTQSRIGATLWDRPDLYIENSPLFHFPKVNTPVVIMHNDNDGAVPWYQGIEMFTALRRLQKPVWMLNYNGDAHNLVQRQNRKDIQRREQQFFDHFLKGVPAAPWIESGVPATLKGIDWGFGAD